MNYQMRIQCVIDELKSCTKEHTANKVRKLLVIMKEGDQKLQQHDEKMNSAGIPIMTPTSAMTDWPTSHLIMVIERERLIKRIRILRNKIIQHLGGHDYYIASLHLYGDGRDYSLTK